MKLKGTLRKMKIIWNHSATYYMNLNREPVFELNTMISKPFFLHWTGKIHCIHCGKQIKKTFAQGYCYPCFINAPQAAPCIIRPEKCEAHLGKGRNVEWEQNHHNQPHLVYLAQTSGVKVGITRDTNVPGRWLDQGAQNAVIIAKVPYRQLAGLVELDLKQYLSDRTDWRKMLTHQQDVEALENVRDELLEFLSDKLVPFALKNEPIQEFVYPMDSFPTNVQSVKLEELSAAPRTLLGTRGQYLYFEENKVINLRKYSGYEVITGSE